MTSASVRGLAWAWGWAWGLALRPPLPVTVTATATAMVTRRWWLARQATAASRWGSRSPGRRDHGRRAGKAGRRLHALLRSRLLLLLLLLLLLWVTPVVVTWRVVVSFLRRCLRRVVVLVVWLSLTLVLVPQGARLVCRARRPVVSEAV